MLITFLLLIEPASNKQNPACIQNTKTVPMITHSEFKLDLSANWVSRVFLGSIGSGPNVEVGVSSEILLVGIEVMFDVSFDIFSIALRILVI